MKTGNSYIIEYEEEADTVYLQWLHPPDIHAFKAAHLDGLRLLSARKSEKWLENRHLVNELSWECHNWARDRWFPEAISLGVRYIAIVLSELPLSSTAIEQISDILEMDVSIDYFDEVEDAHKWLHHPDH